MADELRDRYDRETDIRYAAARGWVDAIIDPARTREVLIAAFDVATRDGGSRPGSRSACSRSEAESEGGCPYHPQFFLPFRRRCSSAAVSSAAQRRRSEHREHSQSIACGAPGSAGMERSMASRGRDIPESPG